MNPKALKTLEYNKIIDKLTEFAGSALAKEMCRNLQPSTDLYEIQALQKETSDALSRIYQKGAVSFRGVRDIRGSIKRLEIGAIIGINELLSICSLLDVCSKVKAYSRNDRDPDFEDSLEAMFQALQPLTPVSSEIRRCIASEEELNDDASPALFKIRRSMRQINDKVHAQLQTMVNGSARTYLQDAVVTMRNGRYCIPVKAEHRGQIPGMIHDQSSTGSTLFVEPMAVIKLNNDLRELELKEEKEIEMILATLSARCGEETEALRDDLDLLTKLDFIFARAQLSRSMNGTQPDFNEEGRILIKKGRHPLLDKKKVVPIDIQLGKDFELLIITGPNTGGKTVSLKTVGLFTLMGQAGLHIPAFDHSELSVFHEVFADIGDEQSIEQSLSTFSAHMTNTVSILKEADDRSLVLFDELGAGTDPTEGAALAIAILSNLHRRGSRVMATTHYSELKVFALSTPGVENGCCEFDVETLRPTYRLLIGVPGKSNAFAISQKLGLSQDIIEEAKTHLTKQDEFSKLLREVLDGDVTQVILHLENMIMQGRDLTQLVNDFTWYLRNLLLLKSSDNMEDVLDVSAENLEQLKEEAAMVRDDTLMRYIRIFSELQNQIKYAGSKRVMLEVALIKLCRPQMEQDQLSVLERVRRLEKQLASGVVVRQQDTGGYTPEGNFDYQNPVNVAAPGGIDPDGTAGNTDPAKLQQAAPEDLQKIVGMWRTILAQTSGRFRVVLASAVPKFNTEKEDGTLYIVFSDFLGETYVNDPKKAEVLEQIIAAKTGRQVKVKMILQADEHVVNTRLSKVQVEEALENLVHADIEIEDD